MKPRILISTDNKALTDNSIDSDKCNLEYSNINDSDCLTEYSTIILDYKNPFRFKNEKLEELISFIVKSKNLIIILRSFNGDGNYNNYEYLNAVLISSVSAVTFFSKESKGKNYEVTKIGNDTPFKDYLNNDNKYWELFLLEDYVSKIEILATNSNNNIIAFKTTDSTCYFLPLLACKDVLIKSIETLTLSTVIEKAPDWVQKYSFSKLSKTEEKINELQEQINDLSQKKIEQIDLKENYEKIRDTLLFRDGPILEHVAKEVFTKLGLDVKDGLAGREDIVFIHNDKHFIIEVKGSKKSASKKNISQLNSHATSYNNDHEVDAKKILLINAWRELPLEERNQGGNVIFPNEIDKLVNLSKIALITTTQLFVAYCDHLEGKFNFEEFISKLDSTTGELELYKDIEKYKIPEIKN